jgi:hypothetical protein
MSGNQCSDFGGTNLGPSLCTMPAGHAYEGLITYRDGRVAVINRSEGANTVFAGPNGTGEITIADIGTAAIALTRTLAGGEVGDCAARGAGGVSFSALQTTYNGSPITWSQSHLAALYRALGQANGQSGNAFFCSNRENAGSLVVNNDTFHRPALLAAISALSSNRGNFSELDDAHYNAMLQSLRAAAGVPEPQSTWDQVKGIAGYLLGGIIVFIVGGVGAHLVSRWLDNRRGGGGGGSSGGGGGGSGQDAFTRGLIEGLRAAGVTLPEPASNPTPVADPGPSGNPVTNPGNARVATSGLDMARAIRGFNGGSATVVPGAPGAVPGVNAPGVNPALIPAPVLPPAVVPPVAVPAPVVVPRLVPVVP